MLNSFTRRWILLLILVLSAAVLLLLPQIRDPLFAFIAEVSRADGPALRNRLNQYGALAPVVAIALILLHIVIPLPAELLTFANGLAFGFWGGLAVSWTGFMLAALITYAAGRYWGRPLLERTVAERYRRRMDDWLEHQGPFPLLAMRLIPLVPFNAICLAAGAIRAPLWTYVWTTGIGILPLMTALTFLGSRLGERQPHLGPSIWILSSTLLAAVLAAWWITKHSTKR